MIVKEHPNQISSVPMQKRLFSIEEAVAYLGLGKSSTKKYLDSIGARRKIGRRVLYDKKIIDLHLDDGGVANE